jgi:hypothetical protein
MTTNTESIKNDTDFLESIKKDYLQKFKTHIENKMLNPLCFYLEYEIDGLNCDLELVLKKDEVENKLNNVQARLMVFNNVMYKNYEIDKLLFLDLVSDENIIDEEGKLIDVLKKIHKIKDIYTYSKLIDSIILKEELEEKEKLKKATNWLVHSETQECCVCNDEINENLKTACNHLICRICIEQVKDKCPICRKDFSELNEHDDGNYYSVDLNI